MKSLLARCLALMGLMLGLAPTAAPAQCAGGACPPPVWWSPASHSASTNPPAGVCRVVCQTGSGLQFGSGALVATDGPWGYVLTCRHVLGGNLGRTQVWFPGKKRYEAQLAAEDRRHDLALLRIAKPGLAALVVEAAKPQGLLTAGGFGGDGRYRSSAGPVVERVVAAGAEHPSLVIQASVRSGDSGGPVFDGRGRVVAVLWGARRGLAYAMSGEPLKRLLQKTKTQVDRPIARDPPPSVSSPAAGGDELNRLADRLQAIERRPYKPCLCEAGCLTPGDLEPYATKQELAAVRAEARDRSAPPMAAGERDRKPQSAGGALWRVAAVALGVSTPTALGISAAWWLLSGRLQRRWKRRGRGGPRGGPFRRRRAPSPSAGG